MLLATKSADGSSRRRAIPTRDRVCRLSTDVIGLEKLAEGGFNHTFLITMHDDFQLIARTRQVLRCR
ncbi:hypothetical protein H2248_008577 [Termitomyces sp. 'cryptogamus']|nr:hypothetical protein H2248_008577 [Termitomyces sp. 'cryptogamus']